MTKFNIGDTAYRAHAGQERIWITCPECLGSGRLRAILGDDSEVSIACLCCERGYEGSPGKIQTYEFRAEVHTGTITAIEVREGKLRYSMNGYSSDNNYIFSTHEDALARTVSLLEEHKTDETNRVKSKEKQHRSWVWNVSYWRGEIRRAKETIARCEARLAVAPKNRKDQKEADNEVQP